MEKQRGYFAGFGGRDQPHFLDSSVKELKSSLLTTRERNNSRGRVHAG